VSLPVLPLVLLPVFVPYTHVEADIALGARGDRGRVRVRSGSRGLRVRVGVGLGEEIDRVAGLEALLLEASSLPGTLQIRPPLLPLALLLGRGRGTAVESSARG